MSRVVFRSNLYKLMAFVNEVILTGDRPTGPLHLGHYAGSLLQRVDLQNSNKQFIIIADLQALTDNAENPKKITDDILQVACDYLSVGIDPNKTTIFIQSQVPELTELMVYYMNLVSVARLQRNPTVKDEIKQKNFSNSLPAGFLCYPISQAADITAFKATLVPVGEDQLPMIEQTVEIVRRFNSLYNSSALVEPKPLISKTSRLPGIDGFSKMSKSLGNGILLKDSDETILEKVSKMYTDPNHLRKEDPGRVEGNTVFTYLDAFDQDTKKVAELKERYSAGGLGDVEVKRYLSQVLLDLLGPIRQKRKLYENNLDQVSKILQEGSFKAREVVAKTLDEAKSAMNINYFKDTSL